MSQQGTKPQKIEDEHVIPPSASESLDKLNKSVEEFKQASNSRVDSLAYGLDALEKRVTAMQVKSETGIFKREPAQIISLVGGVILGLFALGGYQLTAEETTAVSNFVALVAPIILTWVGVGLPVRQVVTSPATRAAEIIQKEESNRVTLRKND